MPITTEEVKKLCNLSRMQIGDSEIETLRAEIESILGYIADINNAVSGDTKPEYSRKNIFREDGDVNASGEYTEKLLALSPDREGSHIKVKKIL